MIEWFNGFVLDEVGNFKIILVIGIDIIEKNLNEEVLLENKVFLRLIIDVLLEVVIMINEEGIILSFFK